MRTPPKRAIIRPRSNHAPAPLGACTLIAPFYRNSSMLVRQVQQWNDYPDGWRIILVDDGSPEPALPIVEAHANPDLLAKVSVYRIGKDIPWNRGGARNLGAHVAETDWLVHVDIDHILTAGAATRLLREKVQPGAWYRFPRWRVGKADETRLKDRIPDSCEYGEIHPHVDSYLIERKLYWETGGYNEAFSGVLGGGGPFLKRLERHAGASYLLPRSIPLHVYTRSEVKDASDWSLSRDPAAYKERKRTVSELSKPIKPLNFPWERVL